jgi:protein TonB
MTRAMETRFGAIWQRGGSIFVVLLLHAVLLQAVLSGLAHRRVEAVPPPVEVSIIAPPKPPPVEVPPQPPKLITKPQPHPQPPKPMVAPPRPVIVAPTTVPDLSLAPVAPPPVQVVEAPPAPATAPVHLAAHVDAAMTCRPPRYPAASARAGEAGTVRLLFLIDTDGSVADSRIETSSGFSRLDEAARDALSLCHFTPGTVDGRPERSWARVDYLWRLQ